MITADPATLASFWDQVRSQHPALPSEVPGAWAFGATPEHADSLLNLVLAGTKTGTASLPWDYEAAGDPQPYLGELSIILDGAGTPRAVLETTALRTVPFDEVDAAHAHAEGEGDRTLDYWRTAHERYWRAHAENPHGFASDMPVICELFRLVHPTA